MLKLLLLVKAPTCAPLDKIKKLAPVIRCSVNPGMQQGLASAGGGLTDAPPGNRSTSSHLAPQVQCTLYRAANLPSAHCSHGIVLPPGLLLLATAQILPCAGWNSSCSRHRYISAHVTTWQNHDMHLHCNGMHVTSQHNRTHTLVRTETEAYIRRASLHARLDTSTPLCARQARHTVSHVEEHTRMAAKNAPG
jgi:hypothetical protein